MASTTDKAPLPSSPTLQAPAPPITELKNICKSYGIGSGRELKVLEQINLAIRPGEIVALLGQSGSGKSSILRCLTGLMQPSTGRVLRYGRPLEGINESAAIVFQTFALYPWLTVEENVEVGLMKKRLSRQEKEAEIEKAIGLIGLQGYENSYPRELSGGMRQRVGIARALVAQPEVLCLDEAFSALDVLTAENLRREVISLWQSKATNVKSVFMVTHNIEEAVEMATQILVLFPRPGHIGLHLENTLPYPRSAQSSEYQRLVSVIHDGITRQSLPDLPPEPAPTPGKPISRARSRMESIPHVSVGQVIGLLSILSNDPELDSIYDIGAEIGKEFGETISIVKAAEILEFVDTPKNDVRLTSLGQQFFSADQARRTEIFREQIYKLRLFHIIIECLKVEEEIDEERILKELSSALPYDNPEKLLHTMIAWGRYARILDYDRDTKKLFIPKDDSELAEEDI